MVIWLSIRINLAFCDYITLFMVSVRIAITFLVLHWIESETQGFDLIDKKEMNDSIPLVAIPALIMSFSGWPVNLLISAPLSVISVAIATHMSFSIDEDNMACYVHPDPYAARMS